MKLSQQVVIGLKRLGNQTLVSEECFKVLIQTASKILADQTKLSDSKLNEICVSKPDIVKESFASLLILLVESSRHNLDANTLTSTLENYNLNSSRLESIGNLYETYKSQFRLSLERIGTFRPQIVDVKWRLDFCVKSSSLEHESRPLFFIQIITESVKRTTFTEEQPILKKYSFICSLQQLQELVTKLRDATRLIHSIANTKG
ncbi:COMM domain-containing protein 3-like [Homalodisca vitripennis]|uniref:COMM domain-containing protein 3-like n=1 Tax=Homalodisca vitripennis TaxID=197043 RepID=UPI001EEABE3D|nr:COMM domain-containing protein 3-like [Homalodisca vitripennis]KAG8270863.1 COMM domain containing 3 [Homalodisca vitripennis]